MADESSKLAAELRRLQPKRYLEAFLQQGTRHDGRAFTDQRETSVDAGSITTANGSALVRMGDTTVLCGITAQIAEPDLLRPNSGFIVPNVELPAIASPTFRSGPPSDQSQTLSDRLRHVLLSSGVISPASLCIERGRSAWVIYIDVVCLNYNGNVFDAVITAVMAALRNTRLPKVIWDADDEQTYQIDGEKQPLQVANVLQSTSFGIVNRILISDPDAFEEIHCQTFLTILIDSKGLVRHIWQAGPTTNTAKVTDTVSKCTKIARDRLPTYLRTTGST